MSLASFFDKAALGASVLLKEFNRQAFVDALSSRAVCLFFDGNAAESKEGRVALELSANLLARLYPKLAILAVSESAKQLQHELIRVARDINPEVTIEERVESNSVCIVVGKAQPPASACNIYIGSDGWTAYVSTQGPGIIADSENPFGASAAACIAVANVFRYFFGEQLEGARLDESLAFSLMDLAPSDNGTSNPSLGAVDVGENHLVGVGAIGNGAVWVLRRVKELRGILHLVDPETVDLSNLQRYVLTTQADVNRPKVALAASGWPQGVQVHAHQLEWAHYMTERNNWNLRRVAVAVDSARDRCAVQSAIPAFALNAWTRGSNLGISRHTFQGDEACMVCLYLPDGRGKNEDQLIAESIGLPEAVMEVRQLLHQNHPVQMDLIERIGKALRIDPTTLSQFVGKSLREFYSEAVCGGVILRLSNGVTEGSAEVPMAFQSAFAGVLLAAEIVIDCGHFRPQPLPTITQIDMLKPMGTLLSVPARKDPLGRCICQDPIYLSQYQYKYPEVLGNSVGSRG